MKNHLLSVAVVIGSSLAFGALGSFALADKAPPPVAKQAAAKEVTLEGELGCGHCSLNAADKCTDAIRVKEGDKQVVYLFAEGSSSKHDDAMCKQVRAGKVTGVVSEKAGKKYIKVSKVDVKS